ncbi:hypothetical protein [Methylobacterium sp. Leaf399]|uniref:hypothetical protein n=1 Tax=Methylobacterium sp. Leaf399 TaxID=1736364 RepID=UPI00138F30F1|nr:hypothetical protein [Methylobacterium sp. Leaf399]
MRDVDFLLAALTGDPLPTDRPMVYRYRSGALRTRMIVALRDLVERRGLELSRERPPLGPEFDEAPLWFSHLPQPVPLFDWPARTSRRKSPDTTKAPLSADALHASLARLSNSLDVPGIHFVEHGSKVDQHPGWDTVRRAALVIEEPKITSESLQPVLRYLAATTDLALGADLLGQRGFLTSFTDLIEERVGLPAVIQAFEERVLLCVDPTTHLYDDVRYQRDVSGRQVQRVLVPYLRDLVALRREDDLVDLLSGFDERRATWGWSAYRLVVELYKAAGRLLESTSDRLAVRANAYSRVAAYRITEGAVLWGALLLVWEDTFVRSVREDDVGYRRGPDLVVPGLAGLGRDFLAREDQAEACDPLDGRWSALGRSLGRCGTDDRDDSLANARGSLVRVLHAALARDDEERPDWFRHLQEGVLAACARLDAKVVRDEECEANSEGTEAKLPPLIWNITPAPRHRSFATVIGRNHAAAALSRHARERTDGVDLLLYGPAGVGKQELARCYARMVLCTQPSADGAACCKCESCRAIECGNGGRIEVDGTRPDIARLTDQIVERVQTGTLLAQRLVFVIRNADRYPPEAFDKLLKVMEDGRKASFVLLAREREGVRLAGQSRCFDYRVRPLARSEARRFVREALVARGLQPDEAIVTLLVDAGESIPRRLLEHCETLTEMGPAGLDEMREQLGSGWPGALAADWPEIVAGSSDALPDVRQWPGPERAEHVRRIRAVLHWVSLPGLSAKWRNGAGVDPALRHLHEGVRRSLMAKMVWQADREGTAAETVWARLVETWLADWLSPDWCNSLIADVPINN